MTEKIVFNPSKIRGLGNITVKRETSDFKPFKSAISKSSANINNLDMNIYTIDYLDLTLSDDEILLDETVTATINVHPNINTNNIVFTVDDTVVPLSFSNNRATYNYTANLSKGNVEVEFKITYGNSVVIKKLYVHKLSVDKPQIKSVTKRGNNYLGITMEPITYMGEIVNCQMRIYIDGKWYAQTPVAYVSYFPPDGVFPDEVRIVYSNAATNRFNETFSDEYIWTES